MADRTITLSSGASIPVFGMGTWHMGERGQDRRAQAEALRHGLDLGVAMIDTAEMYGDGGAEEVVGEAIQGRRDDVYLVSKVYPHNASRQGVAAACARSLKRLRTDYLDLYLLHWPGSVPLEETFEGFERLREAGHIRDYGVSNFDLDELAEAEAAAPAPGRLVCDQVLFNLRRREAESGVLPWCRERGAGLMAYCPLDQGDSGLLSDPGLAALAAGRGLSPAQLALAWLLHQDAVAVIPKSARPARIEENFAALEVRLGADELAELDRLFPPPDRGARLGIV